MKRLLGMSFEALDALSVGMNAAVSYLVSDRDKFLGCLREEGVSEARLAAEAKYSKALEALARLEQDVNDAKWLAFHRGGYRAETVLGTLCGPDGKTGAQRDAERAAAIVSRLESDETEVRMVAVDGVLYAETLDGKTRTPVLVESHDSPYYGRLIAATPSQDDPAAILWKGGEQA